MSGAAHLVIRIASDRDAEQLFGLARTTATSFAPTEAGFRTSLTRLLVGQDAVVLVAEGPDAVIVGYLLGFAHLTFFADGPVGWIEELGVEPEAQRRGVGRALVERFEEWSDERGARLVGLATRRAEEFYEALGYERSAVYFRKLLT